MTGEFQAHGPGAESKYIPDGAFCWARSELRTCTRLEGPGPNRFCAMPMRDLVWPFENSASPFGTLLATNHHLHLVGASHHVLACNSEAVGWAEHFDYKRKIKCFDWHPNCSMNAQYEEHIENRVRKVAI